MMITPYAMLIGSKVPGVHPVSHFSRNWSKADGRETTENWISMRILIAIGADNRKDGKESKDPR